MKKYIPVLLLVCAALCMSACMNEETPNPVQTPAASPLQSPQVLHSPTPSPAVSGPDTQSAGSGGVLSEGKVEGMVEGSAQGEMAGGVAGAVIEGFEHGKQVLESDVPQVMDAIEGKYPGAKVTGISMAEHEGKQVYHVTVEGAGDTTEVYVDPHGSIMPFVAGTGAENVA